MKSNLVVIPTIINPQRVISLASKYAEDDAAKTIYILDNGHSDEDSRLIYKSFIDKEKVTVVNTRGMSLYAQWNWGIKTATGLSYDSVVISNDDIDICNNLVQRLENGLFSDDDCWIAYPANLAQYDKNGFTMQTNGTKVDGGLDGCCFMVRTDAVRNGLPLIDENFIWWGGDDDIVKNIYQREKKQLRILNAWVNHQNEGTVSASDQFAHLHEAKKSDIAYLAHKWKVRR